MNLLSSYTKAISNFLYPPLCLSCGEALEEDPLFCKSCLALLEPLESIGRCERCFKSLCLCHKESSPFDRLLALFSPTPPAQALAKALSRPFTSYLQKGTAAFLAHQIYESAMPSIDAIIPLPTTFFLKNSPSFQLGKALSRFLHVPLFPILSLRFDGTFSLKSPPQENTTWLLLDITQEENFFPAATLLKEQKPQALFGLTLLASEEKFL